MPSVNNDRVMMERRIADQEIQYLLDHLEGLYSGTSLREYLCAGHESLNREGSGQASIYFPLSDQALDLQQVLTIREIPVLFPCSSQKEWYSIEGDSVRFHHDILKSAFYLLSAYQEHESSELDPYGRFPWKSSIQYKLGITQKPVVNYYFEVILEAFEKYCALNGLSFNRLQREAPVLFLSHDVDRIRKYTLRNLAIVTLQLLGIKAGSYPRAKQWCIVKDYAGGILTLRKNPYWTFREMNKLEKRLGISSTWYFLEKTKLDNSRYHFSESRIVELIGYLSANGHEAGIHGTLESSEDLQAMTEGIERLNAVCKSPVTGIRQHFLKYKHPQTPGIQTKAGLSYDATLGFAEQIGFRNSYAYPFRLYDFDKAEARALWQLPLNVMEATLMEYMDIQTEAIPSSISGIIEEVRLFKGVLSILWHNCRLDEFHDPGINGIYKGLLEEIIQSGFISLTGQQCVEAYKSDAL